MSLCNMRLQTGADFMEENKTADWNDIIHISLYLSFLNVFSRLSAKAIMSIRVCHNAYHFKAALWLGTLCLNVSGSLHRSKKFT